MFTNFLKYDWANLVKGFDQAGNFEDLEFKEQWDNALTWTVHELSNGNPSELDVPRHGVLMGHVQYMFWLLNLMEFIIGFTRFKSKHQIVLLTKIKKCWNLARIDTIKHEDPRPISLLIQLLKEEIGTKRMQNSGRRPMICWERFA